MYYPGMDSRIEKDTDRKKLMKSKIVWNLIVMCQCFIVLTNVIQ